MYRLKLFGSASIDGPDGAVTGRAVQRRRLGLLALLAVARRSGVGRDRLVSFLWPDADPERARALLSDSVYRINQAVGGEAITAAGSELRLHPERLPSDVWEFGDALERGSWERAVELHAGPFLDGFFLTDAGELERWVEAQRERMARECARALEALAEAEEAAGHARGAVHWWQRLAAQEPYSSRVALRLVAALERSGDRAAALQHGQAHAERLRSDLELEPEAELLARIEELRSPRVRPEGRAAAARCVAVLPFVNLGAEPENDYFADGITEDVIAQLSKIGALSVIARTSSMRFGGRARPLAEIGAALGAGTVLDGSVRRAGDRVRVVAQLVDATTGRCIWAETYDRQLTDVFAIQTDVALHIAAALRATLSPEEQARLRRAPTASLEAYQLYLRGRHCLERFTPDGLHQGIAYFQQALRADPAYAAAWANIAFAWAELGESGLSAPEPAYARARDAVEAALALDAGLAEAHCMLGVLRAIYEYDWEGSERAFRRALELSPGSADTYNLYGRLCAALARHEEAIALEQRAQELDPVAHRSDLGTVLLRAGHYAEALAVAQHAVEFDPQYARGHATLGWALLFNDRSAEGLAELERAVALAPGNTAWLGQLGQAYARAGKRAEAGAILEQLHERARAQYVSPYHFAYVYAALDPETAFDYLERACDERAGGVHGIKGAFLFAELRGHPRFAALLRRLKLA